VIVNSIGDFAESLILGEVDNIKEGKTLPPSMEEARRSSGAAPAKDVSLVEVPESFMREILGEQFYPQETPATDTMPELEWTDPQEEAPKPKPQTLTEETAGNMITLLEEVRDLLKEMTAATTGTGNIGVNLGGPQKDKKTILKERLKRRVKK
jgi:hypothetical protein